MPTLYVWRYYLIVPDAIKAAANAAAPQLTGNPADDLTLSVPLSADGTGEATHWGCSLAATEALMQAMSAALPSLPGLVFYRVNAETGTLDGTNSPTVTVQGQAWGWQDALADMGLKVIQPLMVI